MLSTLLILFLAAPAEPTPAARRITTLERTIERGDTRAQTFAELGRAWLRRHREGAGAEALERAEAALQRALASDPRLRDARAAHVALRIEQGRAAEVLEEARRLNREVP